MTRRRVLVAAFLVLLIAIAIVDAGWVPAFVLLVVLLVGVPYALVALGRGHNEWFGREQRRRPRG